MITSDHSPRDIAKKSRPDDIAVCLAALTAAVIGLGEELAP
jgi:hypothetical protein